MWELALAAAAAWLLLGRRKVGTKAVAALDSSPAAIPLNVPVSWDGHNWRPDAGYDLMVSGWYAGRVASNLSVVAVIEGKRYTWDTQRAVFV